MTKSRDAGVILINVLVALALGSALIVLMFTSQEVQLDRSRAVAAATQADALVLGAESSVITALRRDMQDAPETDHLNEPWAQAAQQNVALATGQFSVQIDDAQGRLDLNALAAGGVAQQQSFARLGAALGVNDAVIRGVIDEIIRRGRLSELSELKILDADTQALLAPHVSLLPVPGALNVNTAGPLALAAVMGGTSAAQTLIRLRNNKGFLTRADLADTGLIALGGIGFTSDVFDIQTSAEVDGITVTLRSRLLRRTHLGEAMVTVISRKYGPDFTFDPKNLPPAAQPLSVQP